MKDHPSGLAKQWSFMQGRPGTDMVIAFVNPEEVIRNRPTIITSETEGRASERASERATERASGRQTGQGVVQRLDVRMFQPKGAPSWNSTDQLRS